jgi:hypothetical protein
MPAMQGGFGFPNQFMVPQAAYYAGQGYPVHPNTSMFPMPAPPAFMNQGMKAPIQYPEVISWFQSLDKHDGRNKDGIEFSQYGVILKDKGFFRISQLTLDFFSLKDLQEWLHVDVGVAVLIMQYAQEDRQAVENGNVMFSQ